MRYQVLPSEPLVGDLDVPSLVRDIPKGCLVKGLFIAPHAHALGDAFEGLQSQLREPPKLGRYVPFSFYPLADFLFLFDKAARAQHPTLPGREAHRQHARNEFEAFAESTLGRVTMALLRDTKSALIEYPRSFNAVASGISIEAEETGEHQLTLHYNPYFGSREHALGLVEQIVTHFGAISTLTVVERSHSSFSIVVQWVDPAPH